MSVPSRPPAIITPLRTSPGVPLPTTALVAQAAALSVAADRGKALEDFCADYLGAVPGIRVADRRRRNVAGSQEIDLVFLNEQLPEGLPNLDRIFLLEAKNWSAPVGSPEVTTFDRKVERSGWWHGILVATAGITTGRDDRSAACDHLFAANEKGRRLIVLTPDEMVACVNTAALRDLIDTKLVRLATRRSPF